ncbi:hypothetical protein [Aliterella atlantica]|nr:hypothetical protein [Aliterella atlantica]
MKLLFTYDLEMVTVLQYLNFIQSELPLAKYPLASNTVKVFLQKKTASRRQLLKNASYAMHLSSLASQEKLRSFRKLISQEQNILFQAYKTKLYQFLAIVTVVTLLAALLSILAKDNTQAINGIYYSILAIACSYVIYHADRILIQIEKYDTYKNLIKLAEYQD